MMRLAGEYLNDLIGLFYPHVCIACHASLLKHEVMLCRTCEHALPETGFYNNSANALMQRLWGRVEVQGAAAMYRFTKGSAVQELLHQLKYRGRQDAGTYIGQRMALRLLEPTSVIKDPDLIVPVPLHWKKLKKRGYNQCDSFAQAIAETMNVPYSTTALLRRHENVSQTGKSRMDRWQNVADIFAVADQSQLINKHVLLVDDVVTTGATAEACLHTILTVRGTRVSFAAMAMAAV